MHQSHEMKYLNYLSSDSPSIVQEKFEAYFEFLNSRRGEIPEAAFDYATSEWHYNFEDPRSPHDSWLNVLSIKEKTDESDERLMNIDMELLGAYHNGLIRLSYDRVSGYSLTWDGAGNNQNTIDRSWHGDWIIDEIDVEDGQLTHRINFHFRGLWSIRCEDIRYSWEPFS